MTDPIKHIEAMKAVYLGESVKAVMWERVEQIVKHGFDAAHDDQHKDGELLSAVKAICELQDPTIDGVNLFHRLWPWPRRLAETLLAKTPYDQLAEAGALILAEMDRLAKETREHDIGSHG